MLKIGNSHDDSQIDLKTALKKMEDRDSKQNRILLPMLLLLFEEYKLSENQLFSLTSHLFPIRCDTCCFVIGRIANQIFYYGGLALQDEILARRPISSPTTRFLYVRDLLNEMNVKKICCRKKYLSFVVEPFDLFPMTKLGQLPLETYHVVFNDYVNYRKQTDVSMEEKIDPKNKLECKNKIVSWTNKSLLFLSLFCSYQSFFTSYVTRSNYLLPTRFVGSLCLSLEGDLTPEKLYLEQMCAHFLQYRSNEQERFCFTVTFTSMVSSLIIVDCEKKTIVICRSHDPIPQMIVSKLEEFLLKSGEKFALLDFSTPFVLDSANEWILLFLYTHLLNADEYQQDLLCLKRLFTWLTSPLNQRLAQLKTLVVKHIELIRKRYDQQKSHLHATGPLTTNSTEEKKTKKRKLEETTKTCSNLYQIWNERFILLGQKLIEEKPIHSHTHYLVSAFLFLYSNSN